MNNEMLNQIGILIQQEIDCRLAEKDNELKQNKATIKELQDRITKSGEWLTEKQTLLEKIEQLEQYSSISLVRAYDAKVSKQAKELERLEKHNDTLKKQVSELKTTVRSSIEQPSSVHMSNPEPPSVPPPEQEPVKDPEPVNDPEPMRDPEPVIQSDDEEIEFHYIELNGANYFLDSEANELYKAVTDETVGELLGSIKKIKVRGNTYYRETIDNTFHIINSDGNFEYAGKIVKGRAIFKK